MKLHAYFRIMMDILCIFPVSVSGSLRAVMKDSNVGEVLLRSVGGPFAAVSPEVSPQCREHSQLYLKALGSFTPWAINMYDASTNIIPTVTGNIQQLGNFDQCTAIKVPSEFVCQQCRATVRFTIEESGTSGNGLGMKDLFEDVASAAGLSSFGETSVPHVWALCVPSSCSAADIQIGLTEALFPLNVPGRVQVMVDVPPENCKIANSTATEFTAAEIGIISLISVVSTILIASTSYDLVTSKLKSRTPDKSIKHDLLKSFSLYTNVKSLLSTQVSPDTMTCLNGLRFLSILWIILSHTSYMKSVSPNINHINLKYYDQDLSKMFIMNATVTTDTFFLLSGLLLCYVFMKYWQKTKTLNLASFYIHRYVRITPAYAFVIFFYATLLYRLGSGPLWDTWVGVNRDYCVTNWWTNLLYVNNFINVPEMCMNQTWYLAMDMQLYWLSPLILYPLARWPRFGKGFLGTCIFASVVIPFAITFTEKYTAAMLYTKDPLAVAGVFLNIYTRTYARAGPYLIGIALGYLFHNYQKKVIEIPKIWVAVGWMLSVASCAAVLFGAIVFYDDKHEYNALESAAYAGLHRSAWALGIAWVAFACVKGYGGFVNTVLSWNIFVPLGKLTYCTYLCHYIILLYNVGSTRTPAYLSEYNIIHDFAGNLLFSLVLAAVISLSFEIPFMNLDKQVLRRLKGKPAEENPTHKFTGHLERSTSVTVTETCAQDNNGFMDDEVQSHSHQHDDRQESSKTLFSNIYVI